MNRKASMISLVVAILWVGFIILYYTSNSGFLEQAAISLDKRGIAYYNNFAAEAVSDFWFRFGLIAFLAVVSTVGTFVAICCSAINKSK